MAYGEGLPLPETYDRPDPRIKQLARRSTVTPGGASCNYNDIIPADHCLHDVQDLSKFHTRKPAQLGMDAWGRDYISRRNCCRLFRRMPAYSSGSVLPWWFCIFGGR